MNLIEYKNLPSSKHYDKARKNLPSEPGVYFFKKGEKILYIGKATSLKDRVRSYFNDDLINTRGPGILDMVFQSDNISYQKTESVLEALILESNLIKKHQPIYNVKEKDDKSFNHVGITNEEFPRVLLIRGKDLDSGELKLKYSYGPFPNAGQLREALKLIQKVFPFFNTGKPVSKLNTADQKRIGLNIQIGLYPDVFSGKVSKEEYNKTISNIKMFFEGKKKRVITNLKKQMDTESKKRNFEKAAEIKKTIFALNHINDISLLNEENTYSEGFRMESYDIAHMAGKNTVGVMVVFQDGELKKSEYKKFIIKSAKAGDDYGALKEVIERRFGHPEWQKPDLIVVDGGVGQKNKISKTLKSINQNIPVVSVVKDDKHKAREILGQKEFKEKYEKQIIKVNAETHRFAIVFHRKRRGKLL